MSDALTILDSMPCAEDFYALYWNKKPFVVRGAIAKEQIEGFISADELAGLSMDEDVHSRIVFTPQGENGWGLQAGPFSEQDFATTGDENWNLLVQNVELFHPPTAELLRHFNFAPRWMLDDVMVRYSAKGGSVGPHIDNYHVFLTQGQGARRWKLAREALAHEDLIEDLPVRILKDGFDGDEVEVRCGDVVYIPSRFAHEGITLESAMSFSVGLLGPKASELYSGYSEYLSQCDETDERYVGDGLGTDNAGFTISQNAVDGVRNCLTRNLNTADFSQWLVEFFTESTHEEFGECSQREASLNGAELTKELSNGASLEKPEYVKFAITASPNGGFFLGFNSQSFALDESLFPLAQLLMKEQAVNLQSYPTLLEQSGCLDFLLELYNHEVLELSPDHPD